MSRKKQRGQARQWERQAKKKYWKGDRRGNQ